MGLFLCPGCPSLLGNSPILLFFPGLILVLCSLATVAAQACQPSPWLTLTTPMGFSDSPTSQSYP